MCEPIAHQREQKDPPVSRRAWEKVHMASCRFTGMAYIPCRMLRSRSCILSLICLATLIYVYLGKPTTKKQSGMSDGFDMWNFDLLLTARLFSNFTLSLNASEDQTEDTLQKYIAHTDALCSKAYRVGPEGFAGWAVCDMASIKPLPPCVVYSFGINTDWRFDDEISRHYGCLVLSFNPRAEKGNHTRSDFVKVFKLALGDENIYPGEQQGVWEMRTFSTLLRDQNHQNVPIEYVRLDNEQTEWPALKEMYVNGSLHKVKQLALEVHMTQRSLDSNKVYFQTLKSLEAMGFQKWKSEPHPLITAESRVKKNSTVIPIWKIYYLNSRFLG